MLCRRVCEKQKKLQFQAAYRRMITANVRGNVEMCDRGKEAIDGLVVVSPLSPILSQQGIGFGRSPGSGIIVMNGMGS